MMNPLLRLEGIGVTFQVGRGIWRRQRVRALDGITLEITKGETLALVGESGCGKSTLGRVSLRLLKPTEGRITFDGRDITEMEEGELRWFRREAQMIFQDPYSSLDPTMKVLSIVEEPLIINGEGLGREARIDRAYRSLEQVGLTPAESFAEKYPHMLSGGQRQRVAIARALVLGPKYIVADEPVSMVDASSRVEILTLLRELQGSEGITFLYITHDIATARYFSDRMAVMYLGRIVELGPSRKVIEEPLHPYTQALIEAVPEPDPKNLMRYRNTIPGEPPSPSRIPSGCRFHPRCPAYLGDVCSKMDPSLEEVKKGRFVACHLY